MSFGFFDNRPTVHATTKTAMHDDVVNKVLMPIKQFLETLGKARSFGERPANLEAENSLKECRQIITHVLAQNNAESTKEIEKEAQYTTPSVF